MFHSNLPARRPLPGAVLCVLLLPWSAPAHAELSEQVLQVPIRLASQATGARPADMQVTVVRDDAIPRAPFVILLHGRPTTREGFARMGRQRYPANAAWLVSLGLVVLVPTRIGYGLSPGPDMEYTGPCDAKDYPRGVEPVVDETRQLLAYAARLPYVDPTRGVVVGESFGGLAALAIAAAAVPGVLGAVNIAGGDGGDFSHLAQPCQEPALKATFARYGTHARLPTLWMYSDNDLLWGNHFPRTWFDAFVAAGGRGSFVALPADHANGHFVFNRNAQAWQPDLQAFLLRIGLLPAGRVPGSAPGALPGTTARARPQG